jgi:GNAT superfamily N-acetyltransferase
MNAPTNIRLCRDDEFQSILMIVNAAAEAYRGAIPEDCWHDPYMPADELRNEIATGVVFWGYEVDGILVGVMDIQPVRDVDLIHHAYVLPASQRRGIGGALLGHLRGLSKQRMLIGTWAAAEWAIRFYLDHGFELVSGEQKAPFAKAILDRTRSSDRNLRGAGESAAGIMRSVRPAEHTDPAAWAIFETWSESQQAARVMPI